VSVMEVVVVIDDDDDDDDDDGAGGSSDSIDKTIQRVEHCTALHYIALSHSTRHSVRISG
jgi:hypothetical protein